MNTPNPIQSLHGIFQPPATVSWAEHEAAMRAASRKKLEKITQLERENAAMRNALKEAHSLFEKSVIHMEVTDHGDRFLEVSRERLREMKKMLTKLQPFLKS